MKGAEAAEHLTAYFSDRSTKSGSKDSRASASIAPTQDLFAER